jgi:hypothetical protein
MTDENYESAYNLDHEKLRDLAKQMCIANGENPEGDALDAMLRRFELAVKSALESPPNGINLAEETKRVAAYYTTKENFGKYGTFDKPNRAMKRAAARAKKRK